MSDDNDRLAWNADDIVIEEQPAESKSASQLGIVDELRRLMAEIQDVGDSVPGDPEQADHLESLQQEFRDKLAGMVEKADTKGHPFRGNQYRKVAAQAASGDERHSAFTPDKPTPDIDQYLDSVVAMYASAGGQLNIESFVKKNGSAYGHDGLSDSEKAALRQDLEDADIRTKLGECYGNAAALALSRRNRFTYVEGYAHSVFLPMNHAWVEWHGHPIDLTWSDDKYNARRKSDLDSLVQRADSNMRNNQYYGFKVPFDYLFDFMHRNEVTPPVLLDHDNDMRLLRSGQLDFKITKKSGTSEGAVLGWEHRERRSPAGPNLSIRQRALDVYCGIGHRLINPYLRQDKWPPDVPEFVLKYHADIDRAGADRIVAALDHSMTRTVDKPMTVYRGLKDRDGNLAKELRQHLGGLFVDKAFVSTSADLDSAESFAVQNGGRQPILLRLVLPEGAHYAEGEPSEHEMILPRNSAFKILSEDDETESPLGEHYRGFTLEHIPTSRAEKSKVGDKPGHEFHGNQYVYHGTHEAKLDDIKKNGLKPNEYGNPLNFHRIENSARFYSGPNGPLMRVRVTDLPPDTVHDELTERDWTQSTVSPDKIELKVGDEWKPLKDKPEVPPREPGKNYLVNGQWTDKRPHQKLYPLPGGGLSNKPPKGFVEKESGGQKPSDTVGPKSHQYTPPAATSHVPSYWSKGDQPPKKKPAAQQNWDWTDNWADDFGQTTFDMEGADQHPIKPPITKLPNLGTAFFSNKESDVKELNGIAFTEPPAEFWKGDTTPELTGEPATFAKKMGEDEKWVEDPLTGDRYKERFKFQKESSSGAVLLEPDGRVWLVEPLNHYGGYNATFPKGRVEPDLNPRQNALKEIFEETGLQGQLTGYLADLEGDTTITRYYVGKRVGGNPKLMGPEAYSVRLVSPDDALKMLNRDRDKKLVGILKDKLGGVSKAVTDGAASAYVIDDEIAAPGGYFDGKIPGIEYDTDDYEARTPLAAIELVPLALYFGHIVRLSPVRRPLLVGDDPNQVALDATAASFSDDQAYVVLSSWRPDKESEEVFTYAVVLSKQADALEEPNYPVIPISNVALMDLDDNAVALDCVQHLTERAYSNNLFRMALPRGWFQALKEFLPLGGRELTVSTENTARDGGWTNQ